MSPPRRDMFVVYSTLAMLAILTMASMALFATAVLAPDAAPALGLDAGFIGPFMSGVYLFAAVTGTMTGPMIDRFGAIRVCQSSMLACALGLIAFSLPSWPFLAAGAMLLGVSYGPFNPASAHVLAGLATARWRPFVFSVKQLGVPLGGMLAGALLPALSLAFGWRAAAVALGCTALLVAAAVEPLRRSFDPGDRTRGAMKRSGVRESLALALAEAGLRRYTLVAFAFAGCQVSAGAFMVVYLNEAADQPLVRAGLALAAMQLGGVVGRLVWGAMAARWLRARTVLASIGALTALSFMLTASIDAAWPFASILALAVLLGFSSFGWNGVMLSQIATLAPPGRAADATGGMQFVMFGGVVFLPSGFAALVRATDGYAMPYGLLAALALAGAVAVLDARGCVPRARERDARTR